MSNFTQLLSTMMGSDYVLMILTDDFDAKICVEIGAAVLLNKPLLVFTKSSTLVTPMLEQVATRVVLMPMDWRSLEANELVRKTIQEVDEDLMKDLMKD